mmetsp:Transcript_42238/g.67441  ORF Transcript_42238/g.67441 Transcript_42238/m.67441 type:complete len:525 (-) Transcript_42238:11-1585(-)
MMLQPGDVPCYILLSGIQVARAIGKGGAIIRELREESGATINILDRPPAIPEALQRSQTRVALIKGSPKAMHAAVVGLVRNARGPESVRQLEQEGEPADDDVSMLIPEKCQPYLIEERAHELMNGTCCSLKISAIQDVQRHFRLNIQGNSTNDLQIAAWRVHDLLLRLSEGQVLLDKDFDLQDSSWDKTMRAFQAKRRTPEDEAALARSRPVVQLPSRGNELQEAAAFEAEAGRVKEVQERDMRASAEQERKTRLREAQARSAREREMFAREARALAEQARETWARVNQLPEGSVEYDGLAREAQELEAKASEARTRSLHDNTRQLQQEAESRDLLRAEQEKEVKMREAQQRKEQEEREREDRERKARENETKIREARRLADEMHREREARVMKEREAREQTKLLQDTGFEQSINCRPESGSTKLLQETAPQQSSTSRPENGSFVARNNHSHDSTMCLLMPSFEASRLLSSKSYEIGTRAGVQLFAETGNGGFPVLRLHGAPMAIASACFLVQEALWMSGIYAQ